MNRPKISDAETDKLAKFFFVEEMPKVVVFGVRGYFLNTMGKPGVNDINLYDDAWLVYEDGTLVKTFNANTDPSKHRANLAWLNTGVYQFYKGKHKNRIEAFRAYPEGVKWRCKREEFSGKVVDSWCSYINIHDGGASATWSEGCQTSLQFVEFRDLVYRLMAKHNQKLLTYVLLDEKQMNEILGK
jgi:hypothetical protein